MRVAIYGRVSTQQQEVSNQLIELRRYAEARHWMATEFVDVGISGSKDRRPALDALVKAAKRRQFDVLLCWRLDRLGRSLKHLVTLLDELQALGVGFVSLGEGIDTSTPAGRLNLHILGALAEFERGRLQERVMAGLARAKAQGKRLGRPRVHRVKDWSSHGKLSVREAARQWGVSKTTAARWLVKGRPTGQTPVKGHGVSP